MTFEFETIPFTAILDEKGNPWFFAHEVCRMLGIVNVSQALTRLDDDDKSTTAILDGNPDNSYRVLVSVPGLYSLIIRSDNPQAKRFKQLISRKVLPTLRRFAPEEIEIIEKDPSVLQLQNLLNLTREQVGRRTRIETLERERQALIKGLQATVKAYPLEVLDKHEDLFKQYATN